MPRRRGRRGKQLLDDLKETRRQWQLKEEGLDRILWRTRSGRGYGPVVKKKMKRGKQLLDELKATRSTLEAE